MGASRSHGLDEQFPIRLDRPNNPRSLDGELVVGNALRTVTLANPNLVVNLLPGVQPEVFREYLQLRTRRLRSLTIQLGRTDDNRCEKQDAPGHESATHPHDATPVGGYWADIGRQVPMAGDTTLMAHSMSNTITAVAVLQLVGAGTVTLNAPLSQYVDGSPYGPAVTVGQVLSHTAGIPNPIPLRWVHATAGHSTFDEAAALEAILRAHPRLAAEPGHRFAYSNIGYWLLGRVVERASREPFTSYVTAHVLRPLGIDPRDMGYMIIDPGRHATGYLEKYSLLNLAKGFLVDRALIGEYAGRWLEVRAHYLNGPAFGGLVGTARGFAIFLQDQLRPRSALFGDVTRRLLYQRAHTQNGRSIPMTFAWHVRERDGAPYYFKEGGGGGFHSMMRLYPAAGRATVLMTNATAFDVGRAMDTLDSAFVRTERLGR